MLSRRNRSSQTSKYAQSNEHPKQTLMCQQHKADSLIDNWSCCADREVAISLLPKNAILFDTTRLFPLPHLASTLISAVWLWPHDIPAWVCRCRRLSSNPSAILISILRFRTMCSEHCDYVPMCRLMADHTRCINQSMSSAYLRAPPWCLRNRRNCGKDLQRAIFLIIALQVFGFSRLAETF